MLLLTGMPSLTEEQGSCSFHGRVCFCCCLVKCLQWKIRIPADSVGLVTSCPPELSVGTISDKNSVDTGRKSNHQSCSTGSMNPSQQQSTNQTRLLMLHSVLNLVCASKFLKIQDLPCRGAHLWYYQCPLDGWRK